MALRHVTIHARRTLAAASVCNGVYAMMGEEQGAVEAWAEVGIEQWELWGRGCKAGHAVVLRLCSRGTGGVGSGG